MPNKDSFTFSDKLRKSKSAPLSKRLPSVVGGQTKQKRTLVQRAQRDLPFILVAALALLLLPFLSRTGSDDIAGTGDIAWNALGGDDTAFVEGGGADIMPEGSMKDPLDWIIGGRSDVKESGATVGTEANKSAYGSGSRSGRGYDDDDESGYGSRRSSYSSSSSSTKKPAADYNTRKSYDEKYTKKVTNKPATKTYEKTRSGVRKAFERKGTDINRALRLSQLPGNKGGSNMSHALPIGQGPNRTPGTAFREGVRPIALQPMEAKGGVGRSMTGENLYAEAVRSIGEMNRGGPAKANLLAAQMRDVDGKPMGDIPGFGGPGPSAASVKPGAGGPNSNNKYSIGKPWWWDMMNTRSQKMWDLYYYTPRKMFWENMYKVGLGIFNCLATGNKDGDISHFFGEGGSTDDYICVDPITHKQKPGTIKASKHAKRFSNTTESGSKDSSKTATDAGGAFDSWSRDCKEKGGIPWAYGNDDKNLFQVRAECLGLDVLIDWVKGWVKKEYTSDCKAVTVDGINDYTVEVHKTVFGKERENENSRLGKKAVIALLAKRRDKGVNYDNIKTPEQSLYDSNEYVVAAINSQRFSMTREQIKQWEEEHPYCEMTGLVSFISRDGVWGNRVSRQLRTDEDSKELHNREHAPRNSINRSSDTDVPGRFFHPYASGVNFSLEYCKEEKPDSKIKKRALTFHELKTKLDPKKDSVNQCLLPSPEKHVDIMLLDGEFCYDYSPIPSVLIDHKSVAEAIIPNPEGSYVYAIVVEELSELSVPSVRDIVRYSDGDQPISRAAAERFTEKHLGYKYDKNEKAFHFYYTPHIGTEGAVAYSAQTRATQSPAQSVNGTGAKSTATSTPTATGTGSSTENSADETPTEQQSTPAPENKTNNAVRGEGKIFWIVTKQANLLETIKPGPLNGKTLNSLSPKDFVSDHANSGVCRYWWCKDVTDCDDPKEHGCPANHRFNYCQENGNVYLYETIVIKGKPYNLKLSETPEKVQNIKITDLPECHNLCKGSDGVHPCNPDGTPKEGEDPICELNEIGATFLGMIKSCPVCCYYAKEPGGHYKSIQIGEKYYIIDANNKEFCESTNNNCDVAAWSEQSEPFSVYGLLDNEYDPNNLPLTPNSMFNKATDSSSTTTYGLDGTTFLPYVKDFTIIHQQSVNSGTPTMFKLFPKLVDQEALKPLEEEVEKNCTVKLKYNYKHADIAPEGADYQCVADAIKKCVISVQKYHNAGGTKYNDLYFYGFASAQFAYCDEDNVTGRPCNLALSDDRSLIVMNEVQKILNAEMLPVSTGNRSNNNNGFNNTTNNRGYTDIDSTTHRYFYSAHVKTNPIMTFRSRAFGATYADTTISGSGPRKYALQAKDRFIYITVKDISMNATEYAQMQAEDPGCVSR